jgi:hypothetical protein
MEGSGKRSLRRSKLSTRKFSAWKKKKNKLYLLLTSKLREMMVCFKFRPFYSVCPLDRAEWIRKSVYLSYSPQPTELSLQLRIYACNRKVPTIREQYSVCAGVRLTPCDTLGQVLQFYMRLKERYLCSIPIATSVPFLAYFPEGLRITRGDS